MENVINKLDAWADNLEGNNYEERERIFSSGFMKIMSQHKEIQELDLLALR